jgi:hypothetical protein
VPLTAKQKLQARIERLEAINGYLKSPHVEARIRADEREACAQIAEGMPDFHTVKADIAAAIRARKP